MSMFVSLFPFIYLFAIYTIKQDQLTSNRHNLEKITPHSMKSLFDNTT